jgi:hypothetical protein
MSNLDLGEKIQVIANVGVIAGIVFLGLEIRQNNEQLAAQTRYNYFQSRVELTLIAALNEDIANIAVKTANNQELTPAEILRVNRLLSATFAYWEYEFGEYEEGRLSIEDINPAAKRLLFSARPGVVNAAWAQYQTTAPPRFVRFVREEVLDR